MEKTELRSTLWITLYMNLSCKDSDSNQFWKIFPNPEKRYIRIFTIKLNIFIQQRAGREPLYNKPFDIPGEQLFLGMEIETRQGESRLFWNW